MNQKPTFIFALSPAEAPLTPECDTWSALLPRSPRDLDASRPREVAANPLTYGDYFTAARHFLSKDRCKLLCDAAVELTGLAVTTEDIRQVTVYLVKFGALYHPAHVVAEVGGRNLSFVLNVAVSSEGGRTIVREYQILSLFNTRYQTAYWPRVFGLGEGLDSHGRSVPMFLGQWLEGYYEFHLSGEASGQPRVVVWDTQQGHRTLTGDQVMACMAQAARILAYAYNPLTFEAIRQWHHAAGDFILGWRGSDIDLRLITVRDYAPMVENVEPDVAAMLEGLLVYLIEISLKLRLDRLDGVGAMVCHGEDVVTSVCDGFFQGLAMAAPGYGLPGDFDATVREFVALHPLDQLESIASAIIEKLPDQSAERDLLRHNLDRHLERLLTAVST